MSGTPSSEDSGGERVRLGMRELGRENAGRPFADRYAVEGILGEGGAAIVYRARDLQLNRDVALKFLRAGLAVDPMLRERFQREARIAAGLSHPGLVAVHDVGESAGQFYLVMDLVPG